MRNKEKLNQLSKVDKRIYECIDILNMLEMGLPIDYLAYPVIQQVKIVSSAMAKYRKILKEIDDDNEKKQKEYNEHLNKGKSYAKTGSTGQRITPR